LKTRLFLIVLLTILVSACSTDEPAATSSLQAPEPPPAKRWFAFDQVSRGAKVFQQNCAACHGKRAEGAPNWRKTGHDGKLPAPPLNGSGHAWHHPLKILFQVIKNGSPGGQGNMPPWKEKLSDEEIVAAIAWFQSRWPQELYAAWLQRDAASRSQSGG
jgi:mono/diheme cytochrome c family protein